MFSEPCQTSKMERFLRKYLMPEGCQQLLSNSIWDVWWGSEYVSAKERNYECKSRIYVDVTNKNMKLWILSLLNASQRCHCVK